MKLKALVAAVLFVGVASQAYTPVAKYGRLKTYNGYLYDSTCIAGTGIATSKSTSTCTNKAVLRGMSFFWSSEPKGYKYYQPQTVSWLQSDWLASVIRIPLAVIAASDNGAGLLDANGNYNATDSIVTIGRVQTLVDAAVAQGIYAVIDWHCVDAVGDSYSSKGYTDHATAVFKMFATKYKGVPNVMFEVWNEPDGAGTGTINTHANAVIKAIRSVGNGNLVIVGSPNWSSEPNNSGLSISDDSSNVAYTLHFYAQSHSPSATSGYGLNMVNAIKAGRTVFVTEWGTTTADGETWSNFSNSQTWLDLLTQYSVSSCNWDIGSQQSEKNTANIQGCAALASGANATGGWDPTTDLTASGQAVRTYLLGANKGLFTLPDTNLHMIGPLRVNKDTAALNDTVHISATFSESVTWTLTVTGADSGYYSWTGTSDSVSLNWVPSKDYNAFKKHFSPEKAYFAFSAPTAAKTLTGTKDTIVLKAATTTGVLARSAAHSTALSWDAQGLRLPSGSVVSGETYTVRVLDLLGHQMGSTLSAQAHEGSGTMLLELSAPRRGEGVAFVELRDQEGLRTRFLLPISR
jgi:hypothetical protein